MDVLNQLFATFKVSATIFHNGQYCGSWAIDTSGTQYMNFHVVSHGNCFLTLPGSDEITQLSQGDIVLFPSDTGHVISSDSQTSAVINSTPSQNYANGPDVNSTGLVCGYFSHNHPLISSITTHLPHAVIIKSQSLEGTPTGLHYLLYALLDESRHENKGSELIMGRIAEAILAIIFRQHLPTDTGVLAATVHPKLAAAMQAIHCAPDKKWTIELLAQQCFMSRAAFNLLFKTVMQQSPMEYVTQWRLGMAYRMLADENVSTLHAALACGYDNESSFSKAFKRVLGMSPGAIRAQVGEQG